MRRDERTSSLALEPVVGCHASASRGVQLYLSLGLLVDEHPLVVVLVHVQRVLPLPVFELDPRQAVRLTRLGCYLRAKRDRICEGGSVGARNARTRASERMPFRCRL